MPKPHFHFWVQPQRRNGTAWIDCEPHRAQAWVVLHDEKVIGRYSNKAFAEGVCDASERLAEGPPRRYALGKRMPIRTDKEA